MPVPIDHPPKASDIDLRITLKNLQTSRVYRVSKSYRDVEGTKYFSYRKSKVEPKVMEVWKAIFSLFYFLSPMSHV